ncbi:hypothetical protein HPP92_007422 [Vanilla planifolia]|uniref:Uncharacterized protein n=1 Tax=Vanilla planifolia TaxID=51239 RepID=A0A835RGC4_VANPL|nr:hypothetical protein HPP92_007422 [Vanilla planifolia]
MEHVMLKGDVVETTKIEDEEMDRWKCFWWNRELRMVSSLTSRSLLPPSPIPEWPKGEGFAKGSIVLGELEVINITKFESIWSCYQSKDKKKELHSTSLQGFQMGFPALVTTDNQMTKLFKGLSLQPKQVLLLKLCHFLLFKTKGYKAVGYVVTKDSNKPSIEEVRCVRADLTETCQSHDTILNIESGDLDFAFTIWMTRPLLRGMWCKGVSVERDEDGQPIDLDGSNLPAGGYNDGEYWIDLPDDDRSDQLKLGSIHSSELYVHVKPALGGTFTDIVMWVFAPFNGPATLKVGLLNISLKKIGQHVGDWEHFTLRISNFTAEYKGDAVAEPCWLQYMREWGPSIEYNSRAELDKIISFLPISLRFTVERVFNKLPVELYGESGPSGPKEKDNWVGDERS